MRRLIAVLASTGIMGVTALSATVAGAATVPGTPKITLTKSTVRLVCEAGLVTNPIQVQVTYPGGTGTAITRFVVFADKAENTGPRTDVTSNGVVSLKVPVFGTPSKFWVEAMRGWTFLATSQVVTCVKAPPPPPKHCLAWVAMCCPYFCPPAVNRR